MRDGITIGEVNGKIASTRPRAVSEALWATKKLPMSRTVSGADDRAGLLLPLDERAEGTGGGEVEGEAEQEPRPAAEHRRPSPAGRSPPTASFTTGGSRRDSEGEHADDARHR